MKYQREVEVDITPVPEDLIDVVELLRLGLDYIEENMYKYDFPDAWRWDDVKDVVGKLVECVDEVENDD